MREKKELHSCNTFWILHGISILFIWTYFPSFPSCKSNQIQFLIFFLPYSKLRIFFDGKGLDSGVLDLLWFYTYDSISRDPILLSTRPKPISTGPIFFYTGSKSISTNPILLYTGPNRSPSWLFVSSHGTCEDLPFVPSHHRKLWETIKRHRHGIQLHGTVGTESNILNLARIARGCWGFLQDEIPSLTPILKRAYYRNSASNKLSSIINVIE